MPDFVDDAIEKLEAALLKAPAGISEIRFADGRTMKYSSRQDMLDEIARLRTSQNPGMQMSRCRCRGDF